MNRTLFAFALLIIFGLALAAVGGDFGASTTPLAMTKVIDKSTPTLSVLAALRPPVA
jgi:hypothetical protein